MVRAINAGASWYKNSKIHGIRLVRDPEQGRLASPIPMRRCFGLAFMSWGPKDLFCDRDGVRKYDFNQIGRTSQWLQLVWFRCHDVLKAYAEWSQRH